MLCRYLSIWALYFSVWLLFSLVLYHNDYLYVIVITSSTFSIAKRFSLSIKNCGDPPLSKCSDRSLADWNFAGANYRVLCCPDCALLFYGILFNLQTILLFEYAVNRKSSILFRKQKTNQNYSCERVSLNFCWLFYPIMCYQVRV